MIAELTASLTILKGLPTGYNKDLQDDKTILFTVFDTLETLLPAVTGSVATLQISVERCRAAIDPAMLATDVADFLVRAGVPFREAHGMVGRLVRAAEERGTSIDLLPAEVFLEVSDRFAEADIPALFDALTSLSARAGVGGTAPAAVASQLESLQARL